MYGPIRTPVFLIPPNAENALVDLNAPPIPDNFPELPFKNVTKFKIANVDFSLSYIPRSEQLGKVNLDIKIQSGSGHNISIITAHGLPEERVHEFFDDKYFPCDLSTNKTPVWTSSAVEKSIATLKGACDEVFFADMDGHPIEVDDLVSMYKKKLDYNFSAPTSVWGIKESEDKISFSKITAGEIPKIILVRTVLSDDTPDEAKISASVINRDPRLKKIFHSDGKKIVDEEEVIELRLLSPSKLTSGSVDRIKLSVIPRDDCLIVVYDPHLGHGNKKLSGTMDSIVRNLIQRTWEASSKQDNDHRADTLLPALLDEVEKTHKSTYRYLEKCLSRLSRKGASIHDHTLDEIAKNSLPLNASIDYCMARMLVTHSQLKRTVKNHPLVDIDEGAPKQNNLILLRQCIENVDQVHKDFGTLNSRLSNLLESTNIRATNEENHSRKNEGDIIKGGTIGILGGTFALLFDAAHFHGLAFGTAAFSVLAVGSYISKIYQRARHRGHPFLKALKEIF